MALDTIDLELSDMEDLSPRRFLEMYRNERDEIASIKIVPPFPGSKGFGRIIVKRKTPTYGLRNVAKNRALKRYIRRVARKPIMTEG